MEWVYNISAILGLIITLSTIVALINKNTKKAIKEELVVVKIGINKQFDEIREDIDELKIATKENEKGRLLHELISFSDDLRRGLVVSENDFQAFYTKYERYKHLGGNSFVDQEKKSVDSEYKEFKKNKNKKGI